MKNTKINKKLLQLITFTTAISLLYSNIAFAINTERCLHPGTRLRTPSKKAESKDVAYYLNKVRYEGDDEFEDIAGKRGLFEDDMFNIQNNRKPKRRRGCKIGRPCWFCYSYRRLLEERLKKTNPMEIEDAKAIIRKAINMGFKTIRVMGEDTLENLYFLCNIFE